MFKPLQNFSVFHTLSSNSCELIQNIATLLRNHLEEVSLKNDMRSFRLTAPSVISMHLFTHLKDSILFSYFHNFINSCYLGKVKQSFVLKALFTANKKIACKVSNNSIAGYHRKSCKERAFLYGKNKFYYIHIMHMIHSSKVIISCIYAETTLKTYVKLKIC